MNKKQQQLCLWSGLVFGVMYGIGFWPMAGLLPPMTPSMTPAEVVAFYQHDTNTMRLGFLLMMTACGFIMPFFALVAEQIKRIPGCSTSLVFTVLGTGVGNCLLLLLPPLLFTVTAYRPDRDPSLTLLLNDLSWIVFIMPFSLATIQFFAIAIAILADKSAEPVLPRWAAYVNAWVAVALIPGGFITFFKAGPFAWSGLFGFWIPFAVFAAWFSVMVVVLRKAITRQHV